MRTILLFLLLLGSAHAADYQIPCSGPEHGAIGTPGWSGGVVTWPDGTPQSKIDRSLAGYLCPPCAAKADEDRGEVEMLHERAQVAREMGEYSQALDLLDRARHRRKHIYGESYPTDARIQELEEHTRRERAREERLAAPLRRAVYLAAMLLLLCAAVHIVRTSRAQNVREK